MHNQFRAQLTGCNRVLPCLLEKILSRCCWVRAHTGLITHNPPYSAAFAIFFLNHMLLAACIAQVPLLSVLLAARKCDLETLSVCSRVKLSVFCSTPSARGEGPVFCCHLRPAHCNSFCQLLPCLGQGERMARKLQGSGNLSFVVVCSQSLAVPLKFCG